MASIFTRIINGEISAMKVAEDNEFLAFLDIRPLMLGHTLVVPKQEVDYLFDIPADLYGRYWQFARRVAFAVKEAVPCDRVGVSVVGLEVPHAHIHLVPINSIHDMNFEKTRPQFSSELMQKTATEIAAAFEKK